MFFATLQKMVIIRSFKIIFLNVNHPKLVVNFNHLWILTWEDFMFIYGCSHHWFRDFLAGEPPIIFGDGSIPINTIFSGMNIHLPAILGFTRVPRFWLIPIFGDVAQFSMRPKSWTLCRPRTSWRIGFSTTSVQPPAGVDLFWSRVVGNPEQCGAISVVL